MQSAPLPQNDTERIKNLHEYQILDTPPEADFDDITLMASQICGTPVSMVSLVDGDRQWFKSAVGTELRETSRDVSFCGHAILSPELFVVPDAAADKRFAHNPLVTGSEQIRFYAGAPLVTPEGHTIGALCVVDHTPRQLEPQQAQALQALARQVVTQLKLRRTVARLSQALIDQQRAEKLLAHSAHHDGLTGLPNRTLFMDRLENCIARSRRDPDQQFAVLFLDLDRFKLVNDSLGHAAGDLLLKIVADRLSQCVRDFDTISQVPFQSAASANCMEHTVARLGGDEFTILLECLHTPTDAARVAERILNTLAQPIEFQGQEITAAGSIGIVMNGAAYTTASDLLRDADVAMYRAKARGRGRYTLFDATMQNAALARLRLEADLRHAIDRGELELHYQPIVELSTGKPIGFEALARWRRADGTLISPIDFIPVAEETGLIVPIGEWVLRTACTQLATWQASHTIDDSFWMSINLSRRQLIDASLIPAVQQILKETGVKPSQIKLEITESLIIDDTDKSAAAALAKLRSLGVQLSIDDFGTGYSSLSCLHRFPIDILKIDRAFTQTISDKRSTAAVVEAIINLAHALDITVVAEGLETAEQVKSLQALACDQGQGFLYSRPMTALASATFLLQHDLLHGSTDKPENPIALVTELAQNAA